jgi:hypothetical protein
MNDIRILARFISADSLAPFNRMKAVLWDRDPVSNDMLGDSALDDSGCVVFQFNLAAASSIDSPGEVNPDIYIQILLDTVEVFRTPVFADMVFGGTSSIDDLSSSITKDLGAFQLPDLRGLDPLTRREFMRAFVDPPNE